MAQDLYFSSSAAATTLSSGISNSATSMTVGSVTGLPVSYPYILILDKDTASEEVVLVTAAGGTTLTITRGYDSTTGLSHSAGATVVHGVSAKVFNDLYTHKAATSGAHGLTGTFVGTTDTQALTNKDLSSATNTLPSSLPLGVLGYATNSGAQTPTSGTDLTGLSVAVTVGSSRRIRISARVAVASVSVTGSFYTITVYEGASIVGANDVAFTSDSTGFQGVVYVEAIVAPTAGAHTYKLKFGSGSGTMTTAYSSSSPSYILVEDLGAA